MAHVTELIRALSAGDEKAGDELYSLVYQNLIAIARKRMANETPGHTLQPTALVNEAYLRIINDSAQTNWESRRHFFGVAAEAMRRILIESARRKKRIKWGGELNRIQFSDTCVNVPASTEWIDLDEALSQLELIAPDKAELVKLKFFSGLTIPEIAQAMNISKSTADRIWRFSRAWLKTKMTEIAKQNLE